MSDNRYCVIMAGGSANHFWPISRKSRPKQFLPADKNGKSYLRKTFERFRGIIPEENILVITLGLYARLVREQIPEIPEENILEEPYGRNTAPCIAYSTYKIYSRCPDAVIINTPADHVIDNESAFREDIVNILENAASRPVLMTLGIVPDEPETSYGYIQVTGERKGTEALKVKTFVEKPDHELAEVFCNSGEFFWNSGIYAWKATLIMQELETHTPEVVSMFQGWERSLGTPDEAAFIEKAYSDCPKISIDYGVMEKTGRSWLYPGNFGWADMDTWEAIFEHNERKDADNNCFLTEKVMADSDSGTIVMSTIRNNRKLYAVKGLKDFVIIDTEDALLICPKDDRQYKDFLSGLAMPEYEEFR
ncbi:MAG: mannose-1-phosphate guanylyltransferase [Candidatus Cryptobacteroides sp.]